MDSFKPKYAWPKNCDDSKDSHAKPTGKIATYQCDMCSEISTGREFVRVREWKYEKGKGLFIVPSERTFVYCHHCEEPFFDAKADIEVFVTEEEIPYKSANETLITDEMED